MPASWVSIGQVAPPAKIGDQAPSPPGGAGATSGVHKPRTATVGAGAGNHGPTTPGTPAGKTSVPPGRADGGGTGGRNEAAHTLEVRRRRKAAANGGDLAVSDNGQVHPMTAGSHRGGFHPGSAAAHPGSRISHHPNAGPMPGHQQPQGMPNGHGNGGAMGGLFHPTEGGRLGMPFHPGLADPMNGVPMHGQHPGGTHPGQFGGGFEPMGGMGQTAGHPAHMGGFEPMGIPESGGFAPVHHGPMGHGGGYR